MNWNELVRSPELYTWAGIVTSLLLITRQNRRDDRNRRRQNVIDNLKVKTVTSQTIRKYINSKQLDPTKRKSLQPTNQKKIPIGWTDQDEKLWQAANKTPKKSPNGPIEPLASIPVKDRKPDLIRAAENYYHEFFGSRLMIEKHVIVGGLTNRKHTLEVTKGDKVFVDGEPIQMNPTDITKLKYWLDKIQGN